MKYIVRLSKKERNTLTDVCQRLKGSSQKVRRAQILLKADVRGLGWTDARIAEAFSCRVQTVESLRKRLVTDGFEIALNGKPRENPPRQKSLDGNQEAKGVFVTGTFKHTSGTLPAHFRRGLRPQTGKRE